MNVHELQFHTSILSATKFVYMPLPGWLGGLCTLSNSLCCNPFSNDCYDSTLWLAMFQISRPSRHWKWYPGRRSAPSHHTVPLASAVLFFSSSTLSLFSIIRWTQVNASTPFYHESLQPLANSLGPKSFAKLNASAHRKPSKSTSDSLHWSVKAAMNMRCAGFHLL